MKLHTPYFAEYLFLAIVILLSVAGFWNIYFDADAHPTSYQHLHLVTNFLWLSLLTYQLRLIGKGNRASHRRAGLAVFFLAPLLVATTALLSVFSAYKGYVSGKGDFLIVQNVGVTFELGLIILLAFVLRKRRKLHGAFLLSSAMLFLGIALFFTLISFVPGFKIEGPETFGRFKTAAIAGQATCLVLGLLFVIRDYRNGWPMLLAAAFFVLNEWIRSFLAQHHMIEGLTEFVGTMDQTLTFFCTFALFAVLLAATGTYKGRHIAAAPGVQSNREEGLT